MGVRLDPGYRVKSIGQVEWPTNIQEIFEWKAQYEPDYPLVDSFHFQLLLYLFK